MKRVYLLSILMLFMLGKTLCQESFQGLPAITNYSSEDFHSIEQTWESVQDNQGVMFFGNTNGILRFDGNTWKLVPISRYMSIVRSMEKNADGTIFIGSIDNFGYLQATETGSIEFRSLTSQLPQGRASFNDVWHIACHDDLTLFMASRFLFVYKDFQLIDIIETNERFTNVIKAGENLYLHDKGTGLLVWKNNAFIPLEGGRFFAGKHLSFLIEQGKDTLLAGTSDEGVFLISHGLVAPWGSPLIRTMCRRINCGVSLYDQTVVMGTSDLGIILVSRKGEIIRKIGIPEGLISNGITSLFTDKNDNLWITTDNGIAFLEVRSPFTYYLKPYGLTQPVMEAAWYDNHLFLAGTDAVYTMPYTKSSHPLEPISFRIVEETGGQSWQVKPEAGKIYIPHNPGLLVIEKHQHLLHPLNQSNVYSIVFPASLPEKFIVNIDNGLLLVDKRNFNFVRIWSGNETPRYLVLDHSDELWMIPETLQGVYRMKFVPSFDSVKSIEWYSAHKGLPDQSVLSVINTTAGLFVLTEKGLFRHDSLKDIFVEDSCFNSLIRPEAFLANTDADENIWLGGMNYLSLLMQDQKDLCLIKDTVFRRTRSFSIFHSTLLPDGTWLFSTNKGVIRYDAARDFVPKLNGALINEVHSFSGDSILFRQEFFEGSAGSKTASGFSGIIPEFAYSGNSFRFLCASGCYVETRQCTFRFSLDKAGKRTDTWSEWTDSPVKEYTNLSEGRYTFRVISQDVFGQVSPETSFQFVVLPPWYRTFWAYGAYFLLVISLFYVSVRLNNLHLKVANIRLEKTISDRTYEIECQKTEIQALNEFKTRFYSNISHELRTPLTLIISPLEQLQDQTSDLSLKKSYGIMLRNARRLLELINQMLELSKLEKGMVKLNLSDAAIGPVLDQIIMSFSLYASTRNIRLTLNEEEPNIRLPFDQDILEKILHNLLSNALKFTEPGGEVSVLLKLTEDRQKAAIEVTDTGAGIPEKELSRIFERFYQVDDPQGHRHEGIGIGLAFVKELVELHHGSVSVKSSLEKGTSFSVLLPLKPLINDNDAPPIIPADTENESLHLQIVELEAEQIDSKTTKVKAGVTILVVEDNEDMLSFISDTIQDTSHVIKARNGEEGLQIALDKMPDLIIADVMMPKMNGYEMTRELKHHRLTCHIPVIMLTAKASENSKIEGLEAMADDFLTKPFSTRELKTRIKNLIALRNRLKRKYQDELIVNPSEVTTSSLDEEFLSKAILTVRENMSNPIFGISFLCDELAMSRPTLHRKMKALTNQSTSEFINTIRLKHAARLIRENAGSISEIAYNVGFNSIPYFNVTFKKHFGVTPTEFK